MKIIAEDSIDSDRINKTKIHKFEKFFQAVANGQLSEIRQITEVDTSFLPGIIQYAHAQTVCQGGPDDPHECPNWLPSGVLKPTQSQMASYLVQQGFHKTQGYASQYNDLYYTEGCDAYGCQGPIFRTHAIIQPSGSVWTYSYQTPEPNPEVLHYVWPATWWGDYVTWWHDSFC